MRAFVVLGSVSSGTIFLTNILIASGCEGSPEYEQPWDKKLPYDQPLIVWRRSVPDKDSGEPAPAIRWMLTQLRDRGYETTIIITYEDKDTQDYSYIYSQIGESVEYVEVSSEELMLNRDNVIEDLIARFDLDVSGVVDIYGDNDDANSSIHA